MEDYKLAPYAATSDASRGRRHPEKFKDGRPAFERDRDRVIHSAAFRRLEYKTQVFVNHEGDYYRTRLTHSIEVAQIARGIARRLSLNVDLAETLALAHDLGHTAFGHAGEQALNSLMAGHGGFEHNRQSLRVVEILEDRYPHFPGLNLTWESREGIVKHSTIYDSAAESIPEEYDPGTPPTLEAQIINLADEIAYHNHDLDDGVESGLLDLDSLDQVELWRTMRKRAEQDCDGIPRDKLKNKIVSGLIGLFINDTVTTTLADIRAMRIETVEDVRGAKRFLVSFSQELCGLRDELREFLYANLYQHHKLERMRFKAENYITALFNAYASNPHLLPKKYFSLIESWGRERVICDFIAGMTDRYALDEYKRLFEPYFEG